MKYTIVTQDSLKRRTTHIANKLHKDTENNILTFYYNDIVIVKIKIEPDKEC